ncbi:hypothetical protein LEMLEM_LOCUS6795, partial [Lemmus lemmus]
ARDGESQRERSERLSAQLKFPEQQSEPASQVKAHD